MVGYYLAPSMNFRFAFSATILAMVCLASATIEIPEDLKRGKMRKYAACRELFNQNVQPYAVVSEDQPPYKKVCNCSFNENPPQAGLRIVCHYAREVVLPITYETFSEYISQLSYFIVRYRIRGSSDDWLEQRVEAGENPEITIDLDVGSGDPNIYVIEIYAVLNDNTRRLVKSDQVSAATGRTVIHQPENRYPTGEETEYNQRTVSFRMNFDRITDTSIELTFSTESPETFKVEYVNAGRTLPVTLDSYGRCKLDNLEPDTGYIFIISYLKQSQWTEMRRKTVRTMSATKFPVGTYEPTFRNEGRDITLTCPVAADIALQKVSWYKGTDATTASLIAEFDVQSGETLYASGRDPKIEVIDGVILKIRGATQEDAGSYKCRYSILGTGPSWVPDGQYVTLVITWETLPGIIAYYIQYRPYGTTRQWQEVTLRNTDQPRTEVRDLQPLTQYEFEVYDYSGGIQGDLLDTVIETTGPLREYTELPSADGCDTYFCGRGECSPTPQPHCVCNYGFRGERCDIAINFCDSNPCLNRGICNPQSSGYICQCQSGYSGRNCERERTACNPNPCQNSGVCVSQPNGGYICRCRRGYGGQRCQLIDRDPCEPRPCVRGRCSVLGRNYHCECDRGYIGRNCDQEDIAPSLLLQCPLLEETYGPPEMIEWVRLQGEDRQEIYSYDVVNQRGLEGTIEQYRGRLSSPSTSDLVIRDSRPSDVGTYQCIVSYKYRRSLPSHMRLVQVPLDDTRVTVTWRPSRLYVTHYNVKHRDVEGDEDFIVAETPRNSMRYTFNDLRPGGVYEISITPYTQPGELNQPMDITVIPSDTPTTTASTTTTTTVPPGRGDSEPDKSFEEIDVTVFGPATAVPIGSHALLHCDYPQFDGYKPIIEWKKIVGEYIQYLYNKKMPPTPSSRRISMTNEQQLRIKNFTLGDAGTYQCVVNYETDTSYLSGSGKVQVFAAEPVEVQPPTNLIIDVTGPNTAVLTWQPPRFGRIREFVVLYYPTTRRFGEFKRKEVSESRIILDNFIEGGEYTVEVRSVDGTRFSEPLTEVFEQAVERIPSPTNFVIKILSNTQAKVTWQQPAYDGITGFKVQYWDVSRPAPGNLVERTTALKEMVLTNLIDGTEYQVWIQAMKGEILSPQLSGMFRKTTPIAANAPALVRFKNIGNDEITAYWDAPLGWKSTDKYRVTVKSLDEDYPFNRQFHDSAPSMLRVTSLHAGVTYLFTVNTVREGHPSSPVYGYAQTIDIMTLAAPYPDVLTLECKTRITSNIYRVRWYKLDTSDQTELILTNIATSRRNESIPSPRNKQFADRVSAPSMTTLSIDNVRYPQDFGKYKCIASTPVGTGAHTIELVAKYPRSIAPPYLFRFDFIDESTVNITWKHPYAEDITGYLVKYWPTIRRYGTEESFETSELEATLPDLIQGTEYQVLIKSKINSRTSDDSLIGQFINFAHHVRNVSVKRVANSDDLSISWQNPPGIDGTLFSIRPSEDEPWNDQPPMSPDRHSRRIRYPMNPGDIVYFKISALKNNIPTPVVVQYTEKEIVEVEKSERVPDLAEPGDGSEGPDRSTGAAKPSPVSNLRLKLYETDGLTGVWDPTPDVFFDFYRVVIVNIDTDEYEIFNITRSYIRVTQLRPNHRYEVRIITVRNNVFSYPTVGSITLGTPRQGNATRLVPQPTNLRFSNIMRSRLTVSWDSPSADVTDFEVRHRPAVASARWYNTTTRGYTSAILRGLRSGTTYEVQVTSVMETGEKSSPLTGSQETQAGSARRVILRQPNARVVGKTNESFTLRWPEQNAEHIVVITPIGGAGTRMTLNVALGTSNLVVSELEAGKKYRAQVWATSGGRRGQQKVVYTTTNPNQPRDLLATTVTSELIVVRWTEPVSTLTTGYRVIYFPTETNEMEIIEATTNRAEITGLEPETEYTVQVQTKQGNELSAPTSITVSTMPDQIDAPGNADASITGNDIFVRWTPVSDAESYQVTYYPEDDERSFTTDRVSSPTSFFRFTDVLPGHYVVRVAAIKEDQRSPTVDMTATMPVNPPRNLRISDVRNDGLTASWQEPNNINYAPVYDVIALPNSVHTPLDLPSEKRTKDTNYIFERLEPNTEYKVQVISRYGELKSEPVTSTVTTGGVEIPGNVNSDLASGVITVRWSEVEDVDEYEVTYFPVGDDSDPVTVSVPSDATYYNFASPGPGEYEIRVVAIKNGNKGPYAETRQRTSVQAPTNVRFNDVTEDSAVIEWRPPRTRALYDFEVKLTSVDDVTEEPILRQTRQNWLLFTGLNPATRYLAEVVTVFGEQRSEPANASVTTTVPIPRRIEVPEIGPGNEPIEVIWQEVPAAETYTVTYYPSGQAGRVIPVSGDRNRITLTDLIPETEYVIEVSAVINGIQGSPNTITINTSPVGAPATIETQPSNEVVRVQWAPVENVDHYEVTYYPVGDVGSNVTRVVTSTYYDITDLEPGEYEITVTAVKSDRKSPTTSVRQSIGVQPPAYLEFTDTTENEFVVVWSQSPTPGVTKYEVQAIVPQDLTQRPLVKETSDTFVRFEDLPSGITYLIEIIAKTPDQQSRPLVGTVTTVVPYPDHVRETLPDEEGSLEITWEALPNVDNYEIIYYPVGGKEQRVIVEGDQTGAILHDLLPGTEYVIEVTSLVNEVASSPRTIYVTTPIAKPRQPEAQPITENGSKSPNSVRITWDRDDRNVEYEVTYYNVVRNGNEVIYGEPTIVRVPGSDGGYTLTDLLPASEYIVEITAVKGPRSSRPGKVTVTTSLDQPREVVVREEGEEEATITWQHPIGDVTKYVIQLVPSDGSENITIPVNPRKNTVTVTGLKPGTEYEVRVVAVNSGRSIQSQPTVTHVRTRPADVRPLNVRLMPDSDGSYTVVWDSPKRPVEYYRVHWVTADESATENSRQIPGDQNSIKLPGLLPDTNYEIVIQAVTSPSDISTERNSILRRVKTNVPGLPDAVIVPEITDNTMTVRWEAPVQNTYLTGYRVEVFEEGSDSPVKSIDVPKTRNSVTFRDLRPNTSYVVKVTPHINLKPGTPGRHTVRTGDIRTVPVPDYVTVAESTSEDIVIRWEAPQNYEYITKYNVVIEDEEGNVVVDEDLPGNSDTYTATGLRPGGSYNVIVRAFINDRESEPVREIATTLPAKTARVTAFDILPNQFELSWTPADGEVVSYLVNIEAEDSNVDSLFFETERPSILIPDVEPDTTYTVQIITVGPGNLESEPATVNVTTGSATEERIPMPEVLPEGTVAIRPGDSEIVLIWEQLPDQPVQSYLVIYKIQGSDVSNIITVPKGVGETILSSLEPREDYDVWVRALLDTGENVPVRVTDRQTVTILPLENYTPLTEAPIVAPEDGRISVIWENLGPEITDYGVRYYKPNSEEEHQVVVPGTYSGTLLSGLTPGDEYVINVIGISDGQPVVVDNIHVGTSDIIPNENSTTGTTPSGQITIQWVPDLNEEILESVIGYKIIFDRKCCLGEPEISWVPGRDSDSATIGMLEPDTEYVFRVEAATAEGQNFPISTINVVNLPQYPEMTISPRLNAPEITGVDEGGFTATVFWRPAEEGDIPITHYTVTYIPRDSEYINTLRVIVPSTETSHTVTGLAQDTLYRIEVQSTNLPSRIVSEPAFVNYLTPIEDEPHDENFVEPIPTDDDTSVQSSPSPTISLKTRPTPRPDVTPTTGFPEPIRSTRRTTTEPTPPPTRASSTPQTPGRKSTTTRSTAETTRGTPVPITSTRPRTTTASSRRPTIPQPLPTDEDSTVISSPNGLATISWEPFFTEDETGNYHIIITRPDRPDEFKETILPNDVESVTLTSLEPDTTYNIHIEAVTDNQDVFMIPILTREDELPRTLHPYKWLFKPSITNIEPYGEDSTIVHWMNPRTQPRKVTHYVLNFRQTNPSNPNQNIRVEIPADKPRTSHVITGLLPNQEYIVTLQVANAATNTRSSTERQDFVTGEVTIVETTTRRPSRPIITPTTSATRSTTTRIYRTSTIARTTTSRPAVVVQSSSSSPEPEPFGTTPTSEPHEGGIRDTSTRPTAVAPVPDEKPDGVDALPTFDGRVIINWTPVKMPVDNYVLYYRPRDGSSAGENITVSGNTSWASIPEPTNRPGYIITIYTVTDGDSEPLYDIELGKDPDTGGYRLTFGPSDNGDRKTSVTHTVTTQEVYIPRRRPDKNLLDTEYTLQPGDGTATTTTDREYVHWLRPITIPERRVGGPRSVTLRWNPERTTTTTRVNRYRVELEPINDPTAQTIVAYVPTNAPTDIRGLQPGVSYRLYAKYIQDDGEHRVGDLAASFVVPAFSRFGVPINERRFGVNEVWMKELRSGDLLLQWDAFPEATGYRIDYQEGPDGILRTSDHGPNNRFIVLPRLAPGSVYTINIYATVRGRVTQIYTVTVRRKITAPSPPSKMEWYNMLGHSVDLAWIPPPMRITGYRITYRLGTAEDSEREYVVNLPANVTTYTISGLTPGETYTVTIQSIRGDEISRPLTFPLTMVIPTVQRLYFQQTEPQVIVIRWALLPDYVTGYSVRVKQVSPASADLVPETLLPPDQSEFRIEGVQPSVRYEFVIRSIVGDKLSVPFRLQLWTLRAESELSRVEQTGTWTVTWSGNPYDVDYWRIEVKPFGSNTPVFVDDNISRFNTNYRLRDLTPGVEYNIYIYGVKNNVSSTPILIRIPANPQTVIQQQHRRENTYATGRQLVSKFIIKRRPEQIEIQLIPIVEVDRYIVEYKRSSAALYSSRGVRIYRGNNNDTAVIQNLEPGTSYNISITAIKGDDRSTMNVNVGTPVRSVIQQRLPPLRDIERYPDPNPQGHGFFIRWSRPPVLVAYYTVTYDYNQTGRPVTETVQEPLINVPNIALGESAKFTISYTSRDGRKSPKVVLTVTMPAGSPEYEEEPEGEQP